MEFVRKREIEEIDALFDNNKQLKDIYLIFSEYLFRYINYETEFIKSIYGHDTFNSLNRLHSKIEVDEENFICNLYLISKKLKNIEAKEDLSNVNNT